MRERPPSRTSLPTARTEVPTPRAGRYLRQLCEHLDQVSHRAHASGGSPQVLRVEWSDDRGVIVFTRGQCTLEVRENTLAITLAADDADELRRMQHLFAARIATIGGRDHLTVNW